MLLNSSSSSRGIYICIAQPSHARPPTHACVHHAQESEITHVSDTIDLSGMAVEDSYTGPRMAGEFVVTGWTDGWTDGWMDG